MTMAKGDDPLAPPGRAQRHPGARPMMMAKGDDPLEPPRRPNQTRKPDDDKEAR